MSSVSLCLWLEVKQVGGTEEGKKEVSNLQCSLVKRQRGRRKGAEKTERASLEKKGLVGAARRNGSYTVLYSTPLPHTTVMIAETAAAAAFFAATIVVSDQEIVHK